MNTYEANKSSIEGAREGNGQFGSQLHGECAGGTGVLGGGIPGLTISPEIDNEHVSQLAGTGLQGSIEPYRGNDPDIPGDAVVYSPAGAGYGMVLGNLGRDDFFIYDDLDTDGEAWRTEPGGAWSKEKVARNIGSMRFQREARDKLYDEFSHAENYEFRDASMWKDDDGDVYAQVNFTDEEGESIDLTYDFSRKEFSARDSEDQIVDPAPILDDCLGEDRTPEHTSRWFQDTAQELKDAGHGKYLS